MWSTPLAVVSHELGEIVVDLSLAHSHDRTGARFVTVIVVQANLTEGAHGVHLRYKRDTPLNTRVTLVRPVTRSSTPVTIPATACAASRSA